MDKRVAVKVQTVMFCSINNKNRFMALQSRITQVLSRRRELLEQTQDFYEPDVLPATQPIVSKHYRKTQWFGRLLFYRHGIRSN